MKPEARHRIRGQRQQINRVGAKMRLGRNGLAAPFHHASANIGNSHANAPTKIVGSGQWVADSGQKALLISLLPITYYPLSTIHCLLSLLLRVAHRDQRVSFYFERPDLAYGK